MTTSTIATFFLINRPPPQKYVFDTLGLYSIGRGKECCLRITKEQDTSVSRLHCQILLTASAVYIRDTGSSNGTYVNEQALENGSHSLDSSQVGTADIKITTGDIIKVGNSIFQVEIKLETPDNSQPTEALSEKHEATPPLPVSNKGTIILPAAESAETTAGSGPIAPPTANGLKVMPKKNKNKTLIKIN
jgi:pSer/pThr/pTyr-binding forkhead associated (FHA) protein